MKKDVEVTLKQREDDHRYKERELKFDNRTAKVQVKEQEINHVEYTFALMSDFDRKQTELRQGKIILRSTGLIACHNRL